MASSFVLTGKGRNNIDISEYIQHFGERNMIVSEYFYDDANDGRQYNKD